MFGRPVANNESAKSAGLLPVPEPVLPSISSDQSGSKPLEEGPEQGTAFVNHHESTNSLNADNNGSPSNDNVSNSNQEDISLATVLPLRTSTPYSVPVVKERVNLRHRNLHFAGSPSSAAPAAITSSPSSSSSSSTFSSVPVSAQAAKQNTPDNDSSASSQTKTAASPSTTEEEGGFLDMASNAVVTLCGHLFCWPCISRWMSSQTTLSNTCPVCKAAIEKDKLIPIYAKGRKVDPRSAVPEGRPAGQRTEAPPLPRRNAFGPFGNPFMEFGMLPGAQFTVGGTNVHFSAGFGPFGLLFPVLMWIVNYGVRLVQGQQRTAPIGGAGAAGAAGVGGAGVAPTGLAGNGAGNIDARMAQVVAQQAFISRGQMTEDNNHLAVPLPTATGGKGREKDKKDKKEAPRSVGGGSTRSKASWFSFKSSRSRSTPVVEDNSLSITERFFFKTAPSKQQVLMCILVRIRLPPACDNVAPARIVDLLRIAQAKHYRLSAWIDHESLGALPFADKAANLPTSYRFIERDGDNWMDVYSDEINTNFDTDDSSKPLWRSSIIVPKEWMPEPGSDCYNNQTPIVPNHQKKLDYPIKYNRVHSDQLGLNPPAPNPSGRYFDLMSTFHHCLGDGLSMLAFARTFLECADAAHINAKDLDLANINVSQDPPPLLDNLFNPSVFEILPTAVNMGVKTFGKKKSRLGHTGTSTANLDIPILELPPSPEQSPSPAGTPEPEGRITPSPSPQPEISVGPILGSLPGRGYTNVRFLHFSSDFTTVLRKKSKGEKTTIAAVLVVAALTACRSLFVHGAKRDGKDVKKVVPNSQGWVITNSIRHILPQSKLLQGGDRETDEGLKVFGGYAGSVSNNNLKLTDDSHIWDRCRSVKRGITHSFRDSIQRMKVANYAYRRPKLWEMAEKRVDLSKLSRSFSVEIANLGAWEYPCAPPDAPETDQRCRLDYFGGGLNSSFEGSRGLFSLGIITFGGNMSVFVCYDVKSVTVDEAEVFFKAFSECLKRMSTSKANATVGEMMI
ncbi:hypothetical protein HK100_003958 [Physocladia obscura]|uniref:RING-type domain-containing protein n=1 Tax=Physocladia obscura TaxID=109957 RepID=A0AAD5STG3_9FUNG|nr:hypothetical protein HK100_003958 [Physocladia obscura]